MGYNPGEVSLSIPLWFDWGGSTRPRSSRASPLSIPLWFDWGLVGGYDDGIGPPPFNPTLVRLGAAPPSPRPPRLYLPFNPTLVRLGGGRGDYGHPAPGRFQSHSGSIGGLDLKLLHHGHLHFQSHSGSIGGQPQLPRQRHQSPFQSHSGSIGGCGSRRGCGGSGTFNPTLVRLGGTDGSTPSPPFLITFQSHSGSIGGCLKRLNRVREVPLSIPLWFDWGSPTSPYITGSPTTFQSHSGSIGGR